MKFGRWTVPGWLLPIGVVLAVGVHTLVFFQLGAYVNWPTALGIGVLMLVVKHLVYARRRRRP
jgi:hypothetical protein